MVPVIYVYELHVVRLEEYLPALARVGSRTARATRIAIKGFMGLSPSKRAGIARMATRHDREPSSPRRKPMSATATMGWLRISHRKPSQVTTMTKAMLIHGL